MPEKLGFWNQPDRHGCAVSCRVGLSSYSKARTMTNIELPRRKFLTGILTSIIAAPSIVRAANLMPVNVALVSDEMLTWPARGDFVLSRFCILDNIQGLLASINIDDPGAFSHFGHTVTIQLP